jgi:hypothetical protein
MAEYWRHAKPVEVAMDLDEFSGAVANTLNNLSEALNSGASLRRLPNFDGILEKVQSRPAANHDELLSAGYKETNTATSTLPQFKEKPQS